VNVAVLGLWHLGAVTSACLAAAGHSVKGFDPDPERIEGLAAGRPPVAEPGLAELIVAGVQAGTLQFTTDLAEAVVGADIVWVTFDTPVDEEDRANVSAVIAYVERAFPHLGDGAIVLSSSQLPAGTLLSLEEGWSRQAGGRSVSFACSPENLRLGKAIETFRHPDRVVIGVRDTYARSRITELFAPITDRLEWMSVESAEMTKHAINAFLATSVTFANEVAALCECVGADAKDVERGLRTDRRIGAQAYVAPGGAFAGGTLARDVGYLRDIGASRQRPTLLMDGVQASNTAHRLWARRRLETELGRAGGLRVAVWGLTYKPGTDTLRRSASVELCQWLVNAGADVHVHDPAVGDLPPDLAAVTRHAEPIETATGARALVVGTDWPLYRQVNLDRLAEAAPGLLVIDANRFLSKTVGNDPRFRLISVGQPRT
jgi:UDPglucose 6-dehydrogenase